MRPALEVDWMVIKTLFASGATLEEIAKAHGVSVGTLKARSSRENWAALRPGPNHDLISRKATEATRAIWTNRIEKSREDWHEITSKVRTSLKSKDGDVILAKADKVKAILEVERKNYGLDKEVPQAPIALQFNLVGDVAVETGELEGVDAGLIDVDEFSSSIRPTILMDA